MLLDLFNHRAAWKARFGGELLPNVVETQSGLSLAEFFQKRTRHQPQRRRRHPPLERRRIVIANEVQYRATQAHLTRFEEAPANIDARPGKRTNADPSQPHGPYYQWTAKLNGKTVTRRLTHDQARLYQEWIANDRQLRALITKMRQVAAKATDLIVKDADASQPKV